MKASVIDTAKEPSSSPEARRGVKVAPARYGIALADAGRSVVQARLHVGSPNDPFEREADQIADRIMRTTDPTRPELSAIHGSTLQRKCASCELEDKERVQPKLRAEAQQPASHDASGAVERVRASSGRPLPADLRAWFEPRMASDFSAVRLHTGPAAVEAAAGLRARAFTVGKDVVFGAGEYQPHTYAGRQLLAHELTHVVQQGSAGERIQRQPDPAAEQASPADAPSRAACEPNASATPPTGGFDTAWQAAFHALTLANPQSVLSVNRPGQIWGIELGGLIYKHSGKYYHTEPMEGGEGHINVWEALDRVPAEARSCIVGDYHTHGGRSSNNPSAAEGEDFSGLRGVPSGLPSSMLGKADIQETRSDAATRKEVLDPTSYTAYIATPQGRFAMFSPGRNILFSFSPNPHLLPSEEAKKSGNSPVDYHPEVTRAELSRRATLEVAIGKLNDLQNRLLADDPALKKYNPSLPNAGLDAETGRLIRLISKQMRVYPDSLDWLHDPSASKFFDVVRGLTILFIQNKQMLKPHVLSTTGRCEDKDTMAAAESTMRICPTFFDEYKDSLCRTKVITHEYFHYLNIPGTEVHIFHGDSVSLQAPDSERRMADAFVLADVAMEMVYGRSVSCSD